MTERDFGWNSALNGHLAVLAAFGMNLLAWQYGAGWSLLGLVLCGVAWGSAWIGSGLGLMHMQNGCDGRTAGSKPAVQTFSLVAAGATVAAWACFVLPALIALT